MLGVARPDILSYTLSAMRRPLYGYWTRQSGSFAPLRKQDCLFPLHQQCNRGMCRRRTNLRFGDVSRSQKSQFPRNQGSSPSHHALPPNPRTTDVSASPVYFRTRRTHGIDPLHQLQEEEMDDWHLPLIMQLPFCLHTRYYVKSCLSEADLTGFG